MSNKVNSTAIGAFIVGAIAIALSVMLYISGTGWGKERSQVVMVFDGSVKGLSVGAPVALRGVQIGQVTDIDLILDTETIEIIMMVEAEIETDNILRRGENEGNFTEELIARGMRAQLNSQSLLTGLLYIQLDFHPNSELVLAEINSPHAQIPTIPTELQRLSREIQDVDFSQLAENIHHMAKGLNKFANNDTLHSLPEDLQKTLASLETLSGQLSSQLETSGPKLDALVDNANTMVTTINGEIPKLSASAVDTLSRLDQALANFDNTMAEINYLVGDDSSTRYELNKALRELALAGRAVQLLAKSLEEQPQAILRGRSEERP